MRKDRAHDHLHDGIREENTVTAIAYQNQFTRKDNANLGFVSIVQRFSDVQENNRNEPDSCRYPIDLMHQYADEFNIESWQLEGARNAAWTLDAKDRWNLAGEHVQSCTRGETTNERFRQINSQETKA